MALNSLFNPENRNFGLDIARAIAISLVLIAHSGIHFAFGINLGFLGVEIFFVLSGFLIGQIIIREFQDNITAAKCGTFYINRWLRTLPLYYLILVIKDFAIDRTFHLKHFLFIQQGSDLNFFPVSWSLAIEEWFYILIPFAFIINLRLFKLGGIWFILFLMILVTILRYLYIANNTLSFDLDVRKSIPLRFDALLTGVLFSIIKVNYNSLYAKISNYKAMLFSAILFLAGYFVYRKYVLLEASVNPGTIKYIFQTIVFVFFSFSFGFFIIWLEQSAINTVSKKNFILRLITALSILTYAIYLIHYDIFKVIFTSARFTKGWFMELGMAMGLVLVISFILHIAVEKPVMDYRKVLIKKLFGN